MFMPLVALHGLTHQRCDWGQTRASPVGRFCQLAVSETGVINAWPLSALSIVRLSFLPCGTHLVPRTAAGYELSLMEGCLPSAYQRVLSCICEDFNWRAKCMSMYRSC